MTEFKRIFLDTSPVVYYLENNALYYQMKVRKTDGKLVNSISILLKRKNRGSESLHPYLSKQLQGLSGLL